MNLNQMLEIFSTTKDSDIFALDFFYAKLDDGHYHTGIPFTHVGWHRPTETLIFSDTAFKNVNSFYFITPLKAAYNINDFIILLGKFPARSRVCSYHKNKDGTKLLCDITGIASEKDNSEMVFQVELADKSILTNFATEA